MSSVDLGLVVGPQGPKGATGPQGIQGPQGPSGTNKFLGLHSGRTNTTNIVPADSSEYGGLRKDVVTSSINDGSSRPPNDGHLISMFWDNSGRYDAQIFMSNSTTNYMMIRGRGNASTWGAWKTQLDTTNFETDVPITTISLSILIDSESIETLHCYRQGKTVVLSGIFIPPRTGIRLQFFTVPSAFLPPNNVPIVCSTYSSGVGVEGTLETTGAVLFNFSGIANSRFLCVYHI